MLLFNAAQSHIFSVLLHALKPHTYWSFTCPEAVNVPIFYMAQRCIHAIVLHAPKPSMHCSFTHPKAAYAQFFYVAPSRCIYTCMFVYMHNKRGDSTGWLDLIWGWDFFVVSTAIQTADFHCGPEGRVCIAICMESNFIIWSAEASRTAYLRVIRDWVCMLNLSSMCKWWIVFLPLLGHLAELKTPFRLLTQYL